MAATGNITEDMRAIQQLIVPGSWVTRLTGDVWPWKPAEDATTLHDAADLYGPLPDDLHELLSVSSQFAAGWFFHYLPLGETLHNMKDAVDLSIDRLTHGANASELPNAPTGAVLWLSAEPGGAFGVEIGGPDHGCVLSSPFTMRWQWRTLAWSLSDAIACTRELYEHGWFQWPTNPTQLVPADPDYLDAEQALEQLRPIIDKWSCSPLIADLSDSYHHQPERVSGR